MATLVARGLTVVRGTNVVLDAIDLTVAPGHRIGIVGPNGVGKTTLLRALAGMVPLEAGSIARQPAAATVGYLPQEPERVDGETLHEFLARRTGVTAATAVLDAATAALADGHEDPAVAHAYDVALEQWLGLGGADMDARAAEVLADVGLPAGALDQPMTTLSGGEAARASLAAILLARFDVFLLDEPTNDLDFAGLDQLERFVLGLDAGLVVVSHDRAFLARVVDDVLEIDEQRHRGALYGGGWEAYLEAKAVARRHAEEAYAEYTTKRSTLTDRAQREREWGANAALRARRKATDNDKALRKLKVEHTEQLAARASRTQRAMERLDQVDKPWEGWDLRLELQLAPRSGSVVARLDDAVIERGDFRLGPITLEIGWAEHVAILGPNGSGKSTLLGALLGRIPLVSGARWMGPGVVIGELDQRRLSFAGAATLLDGFIDATGLTPAEARTLLAKFGLVADHVLRAPDTLSPGERTRALLALFQARGTNCLVLDEPTNHLDLPAIEQLEQALATSEGTLLLVTHDRAFLQHLTIHRTIDLGT